MGKILVVDDEPGIIRFVRRALESDGHAVTAAPDGATGLAQAAGQRPDLVILDLLMPGLSGFAVLAALLEQDPHCRVLVLSALGDVDARVRCLELGAADYLMKPFAVAELLARVRSRLRGGAYGVADHGSHGTPLRNPTTLRCGDLTLDLLTRRLRGAHGEVELSEREFALLHHLALRAGSVCSRSELLSQVWGYGFDPGSNVVDVTVARLRAKIGNLRIETIRNVGYRVQA